MKITYEINEKDENFEFNKVAFHHAIHHKLKLDTMYDEVFRPKMKYGQDSKEIEMYEKIWQEIYEHFNN